MNNSKGSNEATAPLETLGSSQITLNGVKGTLQSHKTHEGVNTSPWIK